MNYKKNIIRNIIFSFLGFGTGYFLSMPTRYGICGYWDVGCGNIVGGIIGMPMFLFFLALFVLFIILLFIGNDYIYRSWGKFAKIYLPIAIILIIFSPVASQSFIGFYRELTTWWLAGIFLISSLGIIIYKSFKKE